MQEIDRAAQLVVRRQHRNFLRQVDAEKAENKTHDSVDEARQGPDDGDKHPHCLGDLQGKTVGRRNCPALRQDFREDDEDDRHGKRCDRNARIAEQAQEYAGRQRRRQDVGKIVADQQRADQPVASLDEVAHDTRALLAIRLQRVDAAARHGGERRLRSGEESRKQHECHDREDLGPIVSQYRERAFSRHCGCFSFRKLNTSEAGTSSAMKDWPMPRVRMKVSLPRLTFLSWAIAVQQRLGRRQRRLEYRPSASAGRRPSRCASTRRGVVGARKIEPRGKFDAPAPCRSRRPRRGRAGRCHRRWPPPARGRRCGRD